MTTAGSRATSPLWVGTVAWRRAGVLRRLPTGLMPGCATACPTQSIQFGHLDELQERADARLATLRAQGVETARLYGRDENDGVGGDGAFFLLLDEPEVYGLPPDPIVTTRDLAGRRRRVHLVLRPADRQDAGVEVA